MPNSLKDVPSDQTEDSRGKYREILLRHARHPQRHSVLSDSDFVGSCRNPLCGDHVQVQLKLDEFSISVSDVRILVSGCAIATASASLMTDYVVGRKVAELDALICRATETLSSRPSTAWSEEFEMLKPFETLRTNPRKIPCALMAWYALKNSIASLTKSEGAVLEALSKNETML